MSDREAYVEEALKILGLIYVKPNAIDWYVQDIADFLSKRDAGREAKYRAMERALIGLMSKVQIYIDTRELGESWDAAVAALDAVPSKEKP